MPQTFDFRPKQLTQTEKAIEMVQHQLNGIQRQIAGLCLKLGVKAKDFAEFNHKEQEIMEFLVNAQQEEDKIIKGLKDTAKVEDLKQFQIVDLDKNVHTASKEPSQSGSK